jgi:acyl-CoA synthetase (AMP-forming)/AMP-acid ligase II
VRLHELVEQGASTDPKAAALMDATATVTFGELRDAVGTMSAQLGELCAPRDRLSVVGDNCIGWVELSYAASAAGLTLAPLNQRSTPAEQVALVEQAGSRVLAGHDAYLAPLEDALESGRMPTVRAVIRIPESGDAGHGLTIAGRAGVRHTAADDTSAVPHPDLAWLLFSSGTTGEPKGVQLTHDGLLAAAAGTLVERPVGSDDIFLTAFSLCHVAAYNVLVTHLAKRPVVLLPRFGVAELVAAVERHGVTMASLAPTMISSLLTHLDAHPEDRGRLATLRAIAYGSSAIGPALLRRTLEELGVDLYQGYGMTEASGNVAFMGPEDHRRAVAGSPALLQSCGRPSPAVEQCIHDEDGGTMATGLAGEIAIRGRQVTPGYWGDAEATKAAFVDGWYRTGDIGCFDEHGCLSIIDRKRDIVVSGGENIPSRQVEDALLHVDGVRAAAVIGVPDPHWGEAVCACVEIEPGVALEPEDIQRASRSHLAPFHVPKHVLVVDELPRNSTGKVRKPVLREWAAGALELDSARAGGGEA